MLVLPELVLSGLWDRVAMSIGVGVHGNSEGEHVHPACVGWNGENAGHPVQHLHSTGLTAGIPLRTAVVGIGLVENLPIGFPLDVA